jgi:hypothetical protein
MPKEIQTKYEEQLPKPERLSFDRVFGYCAGTASIAGLIVAPFIVKDQSWLSYLYMAFLSILVLLLIMHAILVEKRKLHHYAQTVFYTHFAQHLVRDFLAGLATSQSIRIEQTTEKILDSIANCFSITSGKKCRASIVELSDKCELSVVARDTMSSKKATPRHLQHLLEENTDFRNLWYSINGCSRYYLNNNIKRSWINHKYQNSCFKENGDPEVTNILGFTFFKEWPLSYNSALILPIRYISDFLPPKTTISIPPHWDYYGFLCVDSISKYSFDSRYAPELGGVFADMLYEYFRQSDFILDRITTP